VKSQSLDRNVCMCVHELDLDGLIYHRLS
jgi:hypothetical protein